MSSVFYEPVPVVSIIYSEGYYNVSFVQKREYPKSKKYFSENHRDSQKESPNSERGWR